MNNLGRFGLLPLLAMSVALFATGCPQSQNEAAANSNASGAQDQASDPAAANLAPVSDNSGATESAPSYQQSPPPPYQSNVSYQQSDQTADDPGYGEQPEYTADQPPPALPDYDQPPAPADGYLWTPGYWAWGSDGYYWVPGVWVQAPYEGALWTPGYWGYRNHRYDFYRGYWGQYVGYYGGVNYGFGYIGYGYQGGYWRGGNFNYNRSVNNVNSGAVHNVYNRSVVGNTNNSRVSFNGGSGGLRERARPAELAAMRQPHTMPMRTQVQNERAASTNRGQLATANHGRPANVAVSRPLAADRNVRAPAALAVRNQAAPQRQAVQQQQQRQAAPQRQAVQQQQQRQAAPQRQAVQQQRQADLQKRAAPQPQQRQAVLQRQAAPQRQAVQQQQQRQAAPQRQAVQQQQQHQAAPQRQVAQQQQQRQAPPQRPAVQQQRQAPPQRQAAPERQPAPQPHAAPQRAEEHPKL